MKTVLCTIVFHKTRWIKNIAGAYPGTNSDDDGTYANESELTALSSTGSSSNNNNNNNNSQQQQQPQTTAITTVACTGTTSTGPLLNGSAPANITAAQAALMLQQQQLQRSEYPPSISTRSLSFDWSISNFTSTNHLELSYLRATFRHASCHTERTCMIRGGPA